MSKKNNQVPYWDLEEYRLGMYDKVPVFLEGYLIKKSEKLLKNEFEFFNSGIDLIKTFEVSSKFHLNNPSINRLAWIGQASCFLTHYVPEYLTKIAWSNLTEIERIKANNVATRILRIYETKNKKIHNQMGISL